MTFAILICILPFLLLPPSHGISSQKPRYCWREIYFCSCNLYNWNSWEVANHFCFPPIPGERSLLSTSSLRDGSAAATKSLSPDSIIPREGGILGKFFPLFWVETHLYPDPMAFWNLSSGRQAGLLQILSPKGVCPDFHYPVPPPYI